MDKPRLPRRRFLRTLLQAIWNKPRPMLRPWPLRAENATWRIARRPNPDLRSSSFLIAPSRQAEQVTVEQVGMPCSSTKALCRLPPGCSISSNVGASCASGVATRAKVSSIAQQTLKLVVSLARQLHLVGRSPVRWLTSGRTVSANPPGAPGTSRAPSPLRGATMPAATFALPAPLPRLRPTLDAEQFAWLKLRFNMRNCSA